MEHVLLVEDEPVLRKLVCTFLRAEDYIVEEADSVEEAKLIIATELIDLIVADFRLGPDTANDLYKWLLEKHPPDGEPIHRCLWMARYRRVPLLPSQTLPDKRVD